MQLTPILTIGKVRSLNVKGSPNQYGTLASITIHKPIPLMLTLFVIHTVAFSVPVPRLVSVSIKIWVVCTGTITLNCDWPMGIRSRYWVPRSTYKVFGDRTTLVVREKFSKKNSYNMNEGSTEVLK